MKTVPIFVVAVLSACFSYSTAFVDCTVQCGDGCPDGLVCGAEGFCRAPGNEGQTCAEVLADAGIDDISIPFAGCAALPLICGPTGTESCCESPIVTGGSFYRSYDVGTDGMYPSMSYPATVSSFRLDKYEITVGRFRQFVEAGMGTQENPPAAGAGGRKLNGATGQGRWDATWNAVLEADKTSLIAAVKCLDKWQTWTDVPGANESLPMNCITWFEATAFCTWDGGFLPTEAEWRYAAAGGDEQRAYPWSSPASSLTIDCSVANHGGGSPYCVNDPIGFTSRVGNSSPNGDGRWDQSDLGGNVYEWILDWYVSPYPTMSCNDCANLAGGTMRVHPGGAFGSNPLRLRGANREFNHQPSYREYNIGARCARAP